jgi:hypothetical protein
MKRRASKADEPGAAPDGERGGGNPRQPQRDLRREGDVLTPDRKQPVDVTDLGHPVAERDIADGSDEGSGHEADPPRPRQKEEPHEVPPYARRRSGGDDRKK